MSAAQAGNTATNVGTRRRLWRALWMLPLFFLAGVAWRLANPTFRVTLRNMSEGPITGILITDDRSVRPTARGGMRDPGIPRTFERIEPGRSRSVTLPRRPGATVYLFYTESSGFPNWYDIDQTTGGETYDGIDYEIRVGGSTRGQYVRNFRFTDLPRRWFSRLRNALAN